LQPKTKALPIALASFYTTADVAFTLPSNPESRRVTPNQRDKAYHFFTLYTAQYFAAWNGNGGKVQKNTNNTTSGELCTKFGLITT
jgi:hypothetical protein